MKRLPVDFSELLQRRVESRVPKRALGVVGRVDEDAFDLPPVKRQ